MITPRVLAQGVFSPEDIEVTFNEVSNRATTPDIEQEIDAQWEVFYRDAVAAGKNIWNGMTYRVNELSELEGGKLKVEFAPISFKTRVMLMRVPGYWEMPEAYCQKGAHCGAFVKTADGYYAFVQQSGKSLADFKKVLLIGGILDEEVPMLSAEDLFATMYKELVEEAVVPQERVKRCELEVVYRSHNTHTGFHFGIDLLDTKDEVFARFKKHGADGDIHDLIFIPESEMSAHLAAMGGSMALLAGIYFGNN